MLAILPADGVQQFLVTFGAPRAPSIAELLGSAAPPATRPSPVVRVPGAAPFPWMLALATACIAAVVLRRRRRFAAAATLTLAVLIGTGVGCGETDVLPRAGDMPPPIPAPPAEPGTYRLRFDPSDVRLRGATTGSAIAATGAPVESEAVLR